MSLDVTLKVVKPVEVYTDNITHNLNKMAKEAATPRKSDVVSISDAQEIVSVVQRELQKLGMDRD